MEQIWKNAKNIIWIYVLSKKKFEIVTAIFSGTILEYLNRVTEYFFLIFSLFYKIFEEKSYKNFGLLFKSLLLYSRFVQEQLLE